MSGELETRTVELRRGLTVGGVTHRHAIIREATVEDVLAEGKREMMDVNGIRYPVDPSADEIALRRLARRVVQIGEINPDEILIKKLAYDDAKRLEAALNKMDADHASWGRAEAEKDTDKDLAGGR